ncbi:glutathione S-transferase family protein [Pelagibius litoralis]|uniref:Glutathione S-transferase family protein n=1 Tax=Pelagibius litoralis TaxID=374515 RepID=A0A967KA28_9PROT|nr:glutathione S-transferase N-terminal domain-containing protein [Pelagibius litoralis]NIA70242.1 glutathione S-transferase family protein [Pelagibius litoralis]
MGTIQIQENWDVTIDLYTWGTPNGRKISIALEELDLAYSAHSINIGKDEQFAPDFLKISPNNKIPAIVDPDGPDGQSISLFETGAILLYLAEKTGRLMPSDPRERHTTMQWLMWQMGGFGPMLGQAHHFRRFAPEQIPYAVDRYTNETKRLYGVLDQRLGDAEYLAGDYSVADIATYPWAARHEWQGVALEDFTNVKRWYDAIGARPAVARGMAVPA